MALKITLKPGEKIVIGGAVTTNGGSKTDLIIENRVPILRQKDILTAETADSPSRRIYFVIQLMYMDPDAFDNYQETYWRLVREFIQAAPNSLGLIDRINDRILGADFYQALKLARHLIAYEEEVVSRVSECV